VVNVADSGNQKQLPTNGKERRPFCHPADLEKWREIHCTTGHDLEDCTTYLDLKKRPKKPVAQEPCRGDHRWADPDNDEQLDEINVIFGGSLSIPSKTQGKKLERDISLAQHIELGR
jgi:hypothetical protein